MSLIQLSALGAQSKITQDDDFTLFKAKTYRPASFSMEVKKIDFGSGNTKFGGSMSAQVTYNADLLSKMYLVVDLPKAEKVGPHWDDATSTSKVAFVNDIGRAMIEEVTLEIGSVVHNKFDDVFLHIRDDHRMTEGQKTSELTGRTWDGSGLSLELEKMPFENHRFYVELPFWFCTEWTNALPLVAMHLSEARIRLKLRKKEDLLVTVNGGDGNHSHSSLLALDDIYLLGEYIFLPDAQRHAYAKLKHWYLVEDVQVEKSSMAKDILSHKQKLNFNHMVKELLWVVRKESNKTLKEYYNFAGDESGATMGAPQHDAFKTASLHFNNNERLMAMDPLYFRLVQPRMHHTCIPSEPVYSYSFALKPEAHAPSGTVNMSRIETIDLKLNFTNQTGLSTGLTEVTELIVFAINYNLVSISEGVCSRAFAS